MLGINNFDADQQITQTATTHINNVLRRAPQVKECVLFRGLQENAAFACVKRNFSFSGEQHWVSTSYDIAVASRFAKGPKDVIFAIHITEERALWMSSHLVEHQHNHSAYHEREVLLYVHGKRFQYRPDVCMPVLRTMMPHLGDDQGPRVVVVTLVEEDAEEDEQENGENEEEEEDEDQEEEEEREEDAASVQAAASSASAVAIQR